MHGLGKLGLVFFTACGLALAFPPRVQPAEPEPAALEFFERKIRPVLVEHCYSCHSGKAKSPKGGLRVDSREGLLRGGDSGPALTPGAPEKSRLIEAVKYGSVDLQMPPRGKLPEAVIADLSAWVKMGAPWPADATKTAAVVEEFDLQRRRREHWAWRPIRPGPPPEVRDRSWPAGPIDQFILARLEAQGLRPAPPAERRTLVRRLYFDLLGLPPTAEQMQQALADDSAGWYERLVEQLLESPHFGERWARHWLDLVRYAESRGHEFDYLAPNAWQYRDYVIRAFNADVPYDQLVAEHIAGDLLVPPRLHPSAKFNESILGTGFWFLGEQVHSPVDIRQDEADRFDNMVDVFGKTFLGLTVACARCHDHKFDAISTRDYYALYGFLQSSSYRLVPFESLEHNRQVVEQLWRLRESQRGPIQRVLAEAMRPTLDRLADYLLAARLANGSSDRVQELARARQLDPGLLAAWSAHLGRAERDESDPFHPFARLESVGPVLAGWRKRQAAAEAAHAEVEVVVDYARLPTDGWLPDGFAFGPAPVRPGQVRFGRDPCRPIARLVDYGAAEFDPAWEGLRPAAGSENDPGPLGSLVRAARMIRTHTFPLRSGKLFYLVRGSGQAFASVDSHTMINGPLHGQLILSIKGSDRFQWVAHPLAGYQGHRLHVEFTATSSDFAVARVVQGERAPTAVERPSPALLQLLENEAGTPEQLARGYQRLFVNLRKRLEEDRIADATDAADAARLANWLVQHPELFAAAETVKLRAEPLLAEQQKLVEQIRRESHLAMAMLDGSGENEHVFIRGNPRAVGEVVPRRFLEALAGREPLAAARGSGRLELARQVTDPKVNPFLARVLVNRVWHHLFGRGIVASVDNFGVLGEPPTHPELLDWLADRFVQDGWSIKGLIRRVVRSRSYQMSARAGGPGDQVDPQNRLLHRQRIRRLEGEAIRDAMLLVSGRLDRSCYGPPVPVHLTEFMQGRGRPPSGPLDGAGRRSLYLAVRRNFLSPFLLAFDTPIPFSTVGRRTVSNVPAQSLILLNDPLVHQLAQQWAGQIVRRPGSPRARIEAMYESAFGRPPVEAELARCLGFLENPDDPKSWAELAHVLFNTKEFIYVN